MQHPGGNPPGGSSDGRPPGSGDNEGRFPAHSGNAAGGDELDHDGLGRIPSDVVARILRDLGLEPRRVSAEEELLAQLPPVEPEVRNMYGEREGLAPIGYSEKAMNLITVPLSKKKYPEFEQANARMLELLELRNLKVVGHPFYDARNWVWHCTPR